MTEFLNLDPEGESAIARLREDVQSVDTSITHAYFGRYGANLEFLRSGKKTKTTFLTTEEMDKLCDAWMDFRGRITQYKAEEEAKKEVAIAEACALIEKNQFDYAPLNIQLEKSEDYYRDTWKLAIPAINHRRYEIVDLALPGVVQEMLDYLKSSVEQAEKLKWDSYEWKLILASYRKVFPLEPTEITEAKQLLTEAGITEWLIEPQENQRYHLHIKVDNPLHVASCNNLSAADVLEEVKYFLPESEQGEPEGISSELISEREGQLIAVESKAAKLLENSPDGPFCYLDFEDGYKLKVHGRVIFEHVAPEKLLDRTREYINQRNLELARD